MEALEIKRAAGQVRSCAHCGNPVPSRAGSSEFCCAGCETVSHWLKSQSLGSYYDLKSRTPSFRKPIAAASVLGKFDYLDQSEFLALYSWTTDEGRWMDFYVEGVHCAACIWLTEKVTELVENVGYARLNLATSVLTVRVGSTGSFARVARELGRMGYRIHPVESGRSSQRLIRDNRWFLVRLGVAAAAAGNIMLLAVSLYAGASGETAVRFRWISFALFLPVLLFSAVPFYRSAWTALRARSLSIDVPVVLGLLVSSGVSVYNLLSGDDRVYFDSIAMLVFLLLATRYLIKRFQQAAFESSRLLGFQAPRLP
jgi:Cu2+-exporting ATPase/Cu+-exporting ATPase